MCDLVAQDGTLASKEGTSSQPLTLSIKDYPEAWVYGSYTVNISTVKSE